MFAVILITMTIATWLFRTTFKSNDTYQDSECEYARLMNYFFNVGCVLALLTLLFEYSIAMHFGSKIESDYYKHCSNNNLYVNHGKNRVFGQDVASQYTIDPIQPILKNDTRPIDVDELEPCEQTITTKKISTFITAYVLLDIIWVLFGIVTVVLATTDKCYDSESDLYSDASFLLVWSFVFYFFRVVLTQFSHFSNHLKQ